MKKLLIGTFLGLNLLAYAGNVVYVTPKGKKYHSTQNCRTLSKSKDIKKIDISKVAGRQACKVCY